MHNSNRSYDRVTESTFVHVSMLPAATRLAVALRTFRVLVCCSPQGCSKYVWVAMKHMFISVGRGTPRTRFPPFVGAPLLAI